MCLARASHLSRATLLVHQQPLCHESKGVTNHPHWKNPTPSSARVLNPRQLLFATEYSFLCSIPRHFAFPWIRVAIYQILVIASFRRAIFEKLESSLQNN